MMVSDFVALVKHILNMDMAGLITLIIIALIAGAIAYKVVSGLQSGVALTVLWLLALLFLLHFWNDGEMMMGLLSMVFFVVTGNEGYRRLIRGYQ